MSTTNVVYETIAKLSSRDISEISDDLKLAEDLNLKSVSRIELAVLLEEGLNIQVSNFDIRKPKTVGEVIQMAESKV